MRLAVYPIIYRVLAPSQVVQEVFHVTPIMKLPQKETIIFRCKLIVSARGIYIAAGRRYLDDNQISCVRARGVFSLKVLWICVLEKRRIDIKYCTAKNWTYYDIQCLQNWWVFVCHWIRPIIFPRQRHRWVMWHQRSPIVQQWMYRSVIKALSWCMVWSQYHGRSCVFFGETGGTKGRNW